MDMNKTVLEAIALRKCLEATYNRVRIRLAPHILYTKHDQLYLDGVTLERDGKPPREIKVGAFKLDGLNDLALTDREFEPQHVFNPGRPQISGQHAVRRRNGLTLTLDHAYCLATLSEASSMVSPSRFGSR